MTWPRDRVLEQSRLWVSPWRPADSVPVASTDLEMYRVGREATLVHCDAQGPDGGRRVAEAARAAAQSGATTLLITIGPDYPGTTPVIDELRARGAQVVGVDDILAYETSTADGIEVRPGVAVVEVTTAARVALFERTSARGWGYPEPTAEFLERALERLTPGWFLAHCNDEPSGTGGSKSSETCPDCGAPRWCRSCGAAASIRPWWLTVCESPQPAVRRSRSCTRRPRRHPSCSIWVSGGSA